jgi:hypothetical protein
MNKHEPINKMIEEMLNSFDGAKRAAPRPYLFTRLKAGIEKNKKNTWEVMGKFISRPAIAIAGLCIVIAVNVLVITFNKTSRNNSASDQFATATTDDFSGNVASIYDIENQ